MARSTRKKENSLGNLLNYSGSHVLPTSIKTLTAPPHPSPPCPISEGQTWKAEPERSCFWPRRLGNRHGKCHVFLPRKMKPNNRGYFDPPGNPSSKGVERSPFCVSLLHDFGQ